VDRGQGPWTLAQDGDRLYGRGTADNKGQHSINIAALAQVLAARGAAGLQRQVADRDRRRDRLARPGRLLRRAPRRTGRRRADRQRRPAPGARPAHGLPGFARRRQLRLEPDLRDGGHHSGNWGGLLRNPGTVLANAIACLVDGRGRIRVPGLRPPPIPANVRASAAGPAFGGDAGDPEVDADWGEPGLTPAERVIAWNTLEVLAYRHRQPGPPGQRHPAAARATLHLRFVVGTDVAAPRQHVMQHLAAHGFADVQVSEPEVMAPPGWTPTTPGCASRCAACSAAPGRPPCCCPTWAALPNDVFADILGLPTVWVPHSYAACQQHAPDEHLLLPVVRSALQLMTGLFWDLGEGCAPSC
jgi:acetylornithine deacetylase/succinyl-diaminopimelate desuccinylase-like protein